MRFLAWMKFKLGSIKAAVWFVVGGLAAIGLAFYLYTSSGHCYSNTKVGAVEGGVTVMKSALDMYRINGGAYPTQEQGLKALHKRPRIAPLPKRWSSVLSSSEALLDPWETPYRYRFPGHVDPKTPEVISAGPDTEQSLRLMMTSRPRIRDVESQWLLSIWRCASQF